MERVTIRVPATTANLAAGFDVLGCALGLYNTLSFTPAERLSFSGCDEQYQTTENLAYVAYERVWRELRRSDVPPVNIHNQACPFYTTPSPREGLLYPMPPSD